MQDGQMWGLIGGVIGGLVGLLGGLVGTYFSIRNTDGPRERQFAIRCAIVAWIALAIILGALFLLPKPYRWIVWVLYSVLLPAGILYGNSRQAKIRQEEAADDAMKPNGESGDD